VPLLGGAGSVALLVAIMLLASGALVAGLILLVLAIVLLALFVGGVRREPETPTARLTLMAAHRSGTLARLCVVTIRARGRAGADLLRIRRRQHQLRSELKASLAPLGEAVHHDDQPRAQALKEKARELEQALSQTEHEASLAIAAARQEIERERATSAATEALSPLHTHDDRASGMRAGPMTNGTRTADTPAPRPRR
jgi:multidrug resistance efflux pump